MNIKGYSNLEMDENRHVSGNYNLFHYCYAGENEQQYCFRIALTRNFARQTNFDNLDRLSFEVGKSFRFLLFFKEFRFDSRIDFLDYQYGKTKQPKKFLARVQYFLEHIDRAEFGPDYSYNHIVEQTISEWLKEKNNESKVHFQKNELKHRHHALIYKYKANAGYIIPNAFNGTEIQNEFGAKRKQAFYSVWDKAGKTYKAPTGNELNTIIPYLSEYPNAQKAAINDLANLS